MKSILQNLAKLWRNRFAKWVFDKFMQKKFRETNYTPKFSKIWKVFCKILQDLDKIISLNFVRVNFDFVQFHISRNYKARFVTTLGGWVQISCSRQPKGQVGEGLPNHGLSKPYCPSKLWGGFRASTPFYGLSLSGGTTRHNCISKA